MAHGKGGKPSWTLLENSHNSNLLSSSRTKRREKFRQLLIIILLRRQHVWVENFASQNTFFFHNHKQFNVNNPSLQWMCEELIRLTINSIPKRKGKLSPSFSSEAISQVDSLFLLVNDQSLMSLSVQFHTRCGRDSCNTREGTRRRSVRR